MKNTKKIKFNRNLEAGVLGLITLFIGSLNLIIIAVSQASKQDLKLLIIGISIFCLGFLLTFLAPTFTTFDLQSRKIYKWRGIFPIFKKEYDFNDIQNIEIKKSNKIFIKDLESESGNIPIKFKETFELIIKTQNKTFIISSYKLNKKQIDEKMKIIKSHLNHPLPPTNN